MNQELNFKVILASITDNSKQMKEVIATLLSTIFNAPESQTAALLNKLPVILFENISANDLKALKDSFIFLSKFGLDFNITPKASPNIPKAAWKPSVSIPIVTCPSCGEMFCMVRAKDFMQPSNVAAAVAYSSKTTVPESKALSGVKKQTSPTTSAVKVPAKEVSYTKAKEESPAQKSVPPAKKEIPSSVKKATPEMPKKVEIKKESTPKKELKVPENLLGAASEFENVEVLSAELESIADMEEKNSFSDIEEIEEVESISEEVNDVDNLVEELEELDDSSFSSRKPSFSMSDKMDEMEAIGGISAEFEEIEGVSAEFERICLEGMENDIGSLSAELEEIEGISQELESVEEEGLEKIGEVSDGFRKVALSKNFQNPGKDLELEDMQGISRELEGISDTVASVQMIKRNPLYGADSETQFTMEPGSYKALINFAGRGNIKAGTQLLAKIKGITEQQAQDMAKNRAAIVVASNISRQSAENIIKEFEKLQMQGRIIS